MDSKHKLTRRRFVLITTIGTGSVCLLSKCSAAAAQWRFFTDEEAKIMDALADLIIPPDDWPGGRDSGVTNFIDKQLTGPYARFQTTYRNGLAAIRKTCLEFFHKNFDELALDVQNAFLERMEAGNMDGPDWSGGFDSKFFALFRDHSMQAYYGSPRHGGNKNNQSYKMLGLDYPLIIGQNRYNIVYGK
jgi:gluconate 2-dehydrogenase gamma chain